jgi:tRNA(fMet)-specific endonuclease VapC
LIGTALVDTDVVSFMVKQDTRAGLYRPHLDGRLLAVSFQTVGELERWARLHGWGERCTNELQKFLGSTRCG